MSELRKKIEEVHRELIYHGRHFSKSRDAVVLKKTIHYVLSLLDKEIEETLKVSLIEKQNKGLKNILQSLL